MEFLPQCIRVVFLTVVRMENISRFLLQPSLAKKRLGWLILLALFMKSGVCKHLICKTMVLIVQAMQIIIEPVHRVLIKDIKISNQ